MITETAIFQDVILCSVVVCLYLQSLSRLLHQPTSDPTACTHCLLTQLVAFLAYSLVIPSSHWSVCTRLHNITSQQAVPHYATINTAAPSSQQQTILILVTAGPTGKLLLSLTAGQQNVHSHLRKVRLHIREGPFCSTVLRQTGRDTTLLPRWGAQTETIPKHILISQ
jgi:hypothetical protein